MRNSVVAMPARAAAADAGAGLSADEIGEIAADAFTYAYPLAVMELTRRTRVNVSGPSPDGRAPMNQFGHVAALPDATLANVARPNADALDSTLWFDVSDEPLVIGVPESGGRYYVMQMMDMWTDVFAAPGSRTTGTAAQRYVLVGPDWRGAVPPGADVIRCPTAVGWVVTRTATAGKADYPAANEFQNAFTASPLSRTAAPHTPSQGAIDPRRNTTTRPVDQVAALGADAFLALGTQLMQRNPPHANDYPMLHRMRRIGLEAGKSFAASNVGEKVRNAMNAAVPVALERITMRRASAGEAINGWTMTRRGVGAWGTDYAARAGAAYARLGEATADDQVCASALADDRGRSLSSDQRYELHFGAGRLPPVRAFWSLTMYTERMTFAANKLDRYAIGDRNTLRHNDDGSLDLFIQRDSPGRDRESNWLPAPAHGEFSLALRLYWPTHAVLDGAWTPPPLKRVR